MGWEVIDEGRRMKDEGRRTKDERGRTKDEGRKRKGEQISMSNFTIFEVRSFELCVLIFDFTFDF
jgi:hypothetical protein